MAGAAGWCSSCSLERRSGAGFRFVVQHSPNRLLLIPLIAVFMPLSVEAAIIDLDHWRHFFLVGGLIWGVTAAYRKTLPGESARLAALV